MEAGNLIALLQLNVHLDASRPLELYILTSACLENAREDEHLSKK
jgi:hypothetical protein